MRCKIITGQYNSLPPRTSVGRAELLGDHILFIPELDEHLPPEYPRRHFSGYLMEVKDIQLLEID